MSQSWTRERARVASLSRSRSHDDPELVQARESLKAARDAEIPDQRFVSLTTASARWGVSVDTCRRLIASGKVKAYRLNNRIIRVDLAEVDACFRPIPTAGADS